jgi:hypothetical protein
VRGSRLEGSGAQCLAVAGDSVYVGCRGSGLTVGRVARPAGPDCGIDLVAETQSGELWAIQCKAVAADYAIRKEKIDSFLAESAQKRFARRLLVATTDRLAT